MIGFPSSLKSVFDGSARPDMPAVHGFPKAWPLLKLVTPSRPERPRAELARMVESEIVPRMISAHRTPLSVVNTTADPEPSLGFDAPRSFAGMLLSKRPDALIAFVEALMKGGLSVEAIYDELLAPAARILAELWDEDQVSYTEVTIGFGRLQQLIRDLDWTTPYNGESDTTARSALFSPRPGETQTFGFYVIEELFRWSAWRTWIETSATNAQMISNVGCRWFDVLCLSVSRANDIGEVSATIEAIRGSSRNPDLFVMVNGQPFVEQHELAATVGADAAVGCGREALQAADKAVWRGD